MIAADHARDVPALLAAADQLREQAAVKLVHADRLLAESRGLLARTKPRAVETTARLSLDEEGNLWLHEESEAAVTDVILGPVDDSATARRVPAGLVGRLGELGAEWAEMVANGEADRDEVKASWLAAKEGPR